MLTTLVQFRVAQPVTPAQARTMFLESAPKYRAVPGLERKYYLLSEDGLRVGGVYLWRTRADAERLFDAAWHARLTAKYGSAPEITWFATPVVVDNLAGTVIDAA
jgi:hypothetical protein